MPCSRIDSHLAFPRFFESSRVRVVVALALLVSLAIFRTRRIPDTFWLMGDQILYWKMAIGSWRDLPLGGGPSSVGGSTLGPAFVWILWAIRHAVGPFTDNLPHAGGIGISILQSAADAVFFVAIWKRFESLPLALAVTLFAATSPFDMEVSATIWNPPVAVALVKLTIAFVLFGGMDGSLWWGAAATAAALLALQTHMSGLFVALPAIAAFPAREWLAERQHRAWIVAGVSALIVAVLEAPFVFDLIAGPPRPASPSLIAYSVRHTFAHPETLRPAASFREVAEACNFILLQPWSFSWFGTALVCAAVVVMVRMRRDVTLIGVTVAPLAFAVAGFAFWQLPYDHYWFLTLAPSAALTIGLALVAWQPAARFVAIALALLVLAIQPARFASAMTALRLPQYGALVRGTKEVRARTSEVRSLETGQLGLPPSTDPVFVYEILGGRVAPEAPLAATIDASGHARFTP